MSSVIRYFPLGVWRRFAPPPSLALTMPVVNCGVEVTLGVEEGGNGVAVASDVSVAGDVTVNVAVSVAVGVSVPVAVTVTVPTVGVMEGVSVMVDVFDGVGLLVVVAVGLGVREGVAVGSTVSVAVGVAVAKTSEGEGSPVPIRGMRIAANKSKETKLNAIPLGVGRRRIAKRVNKPRTLASAKWTRKTRIPWGQMPATPEPSPKPPALTGR